MLTSEILRRFLLDLKTWFRVERVLILAVPTGIIAGLGSVVFFTALDLSHTFFLDYLAGYRPAYPGGEHPVLEPGPTAHLIRWMLVVVPTIGGILSGWLVYTFAPEAEGHGTDAPIDAYHFKNAAIRARVPLIKIISSAITIGSGGSGGREGPIAQIGAGFGSTIALRLGLSRQERRILMMAGMSAGIGSIFHAPLAGAIFAAEILYREIDMEYELLVPSAITSVIAYCVFSLFFGFGSLFVTPPVGFVNTGEILPYTILAIVLALIANIYARVFYGVRDIFRKLPVKPHLKPAIGGFLTGLIGYFIPASLYTGYGILQQALNGELLVGFLLAVAAAKILTTAFSIASGGSGGVFGPSVVIGGAIGGATGLFLEKLWPSLVPNPEAYIIVGMAGFFSSAASTPFSTIIMVSEMTGNYGLLLPAVWVSTLAFLLRGERGIYEKQIATRYDSPVHHGDFMLGVLARLTVQEALKRYKSSQPGSVNQDTPMPELIRHISGSPCCTFPVVDDKGRYLGVVTDIKIRNVIAARGLASDIKASDLMESRGTVYSWESLSTVLTQMSAEGSDEVVVLSGNGAKKTVAGVLSRSDILRIYDEAI
ncbi:MAG: chloride channel protein [Thermodesulfobacteriota bacterium]|nr:MAG: chloride channel protein [Thermodesulfobacteriota bacterium]